MTEAVAHTVVVDFDGTITVEDMLEVIGRRHAPEALAAAEQALVAGEIDLDECIRREFAPIRAEHDQIVAEMLAEAEVRAGFAEFVRAAEAAGDSVVVISSGFEELIRPVLNAAGVGDLEVIAHDVRFSPQGSTVTLRDGPRCERCSERCKRPLVARRADWSAVAYVGDGWSDRCASLAAERRFARDGLARYLDTEGAAYTRFETFHDVSAAMGYTVGSD